MSEKELYELLDSLEVQGASSEEIRAVLARIELVNQATFQQVADVALESLVRVLGKQGVPFALAMGSLLGWRRNCDWIKHDHDVDVFLFSEHFRGWSRGRFFDEVVAPLAEELHEYLEVPDKAMLMMWQDEADDPDQDEMPVLNVLLPSKPPVGRELGRRGNLAFVELHVVHRRPAQYFWSSTSDVSFFKWRPFDLCDTQFRGLPVKVPCNVDQLLQDAYGDGWAVPLEADALGIRAFQHANYVERGESEYYRVVVKGLGCEDCS